MNTRSFSLLCFTLAASWTTTRSLAELEIIQCTKAHSFLAPIESSERFKYAPDREIDILHLALEITPDFKQRTISGRATYRFKPIAKPFTQLSLDAVDLTIDGVTSAEKILAYQATGKKVVVSFAAPIAPEREVSVTITYHGEPTQGLYFRTPEMGYRDGDTHLFTQGEPIEACHWYPCFDSPNEKFTSEVTCRVPEGMTALSNGRLMSQEKDAGTGLVAVRWLQDKPHASYLLSLVAGYFKKVEDRYREIPLAFWTPPSEIAEAPSSFRDTKDAMGFFEQEIGVPYPWAKYDQVCVNDFVAGGMENTSITTLTDNTLFTTNSESIRDSQGLVAHELAHQWFGDLVTCKDWSHTWLNEGFATYYALLYDEHKNGHDSMLYGLYHEARTVLGQPNDTNAIVRRTYDHPNDVFNYLAYPKGGWVLHMLRSQLGPELYRRCIKTYLERHQYDSVVTEDLNAVVEELSGRSYDQFFDQWVYHAHYPELEVTYAWDEKAKLARLTVRQNQRLGNDVLLFRFPLTVRFKSRTDKADRQITVKEKAEDFYFSLNAAPEIVRLDPDYTLLAKITFNVPTAMLYAQLSDNEDVVGRLFSIEQLAGKTDHETVAKLKRALNQDPSYGVRLEASKALRAIHTDETLDALVASTQQSDARVRRQVIADISGFYAETSYAAARKTLESEKNPDVLSEAIRALGAYGQPEVRELLLRYLTSNSYRNLLADAAVSAIRAQSDAAYIDPVREVLTRREAEFPTRGFTNGLETLAYLARNEEKKDAVRDFLVRYVNHKKKNVQLAVIRALGTLGDPKAIAVLEKFTTTRKESPERMAAGKAVADLRAERKPADDRKSLSNEVLELQKANRELRKELDDLKKKVEAAVPAPSKPKKTPATPKGARR